MRENYDDTVKFSGNNAQQNQNFPVQFFTLKDGERAIVRILVDSLQDLAPFTYHDIETADGARKKVGCIRGLREDINKCPLCAAGNQVVPISYIHLLQYFQNPDGTWRAEAKTWGKKPSMSDKSVIGMVRKALDEYGPLSDYISTITRTGSELNTTYSLSINVPEKVYGPASNYPLDRSAFEGYTEDGLLIKNWSTDEMVNFLKTGEVPAKPTNTEQTFNPNTAKPAYQNVPNSVNDTNLPFNNPTTSQYQQPVTQGYTQSVVNDNDLPFANNSIGNSVNYGVPNQQSMDRPVRRYN